MSTTLNGKKTLITGAASGIGRATAELAARKGAELVLTDVNADGLAQAVSAITAAGGKVLVAKAFDITDYDAVVEFGKSVHDAHGSLDIVMNVAGISAWGTVENLTHQHWKSMIDVNLMGPIHIIEVFIPPMIAAKRGGNLVNVSSAAGLLALPWHAAYSASKFGLRGLSEVLRFDLKRHKIHVHLVVPGAVKTPLVETVQIAGVDREDEKIQKYVKLFVKAAITPEQAAAKIIEGVEKNRFMVYTSKDIEFGYWWARKFAPPYEFVMQAANNKFSSVLPK